MTSADATELLLPSTALADICFGGVFMELRLPMASPPKLTCENQLGTLLLPSALAVQRLPAHCSQEPFRGAEWHVLNVLGSHCVVCP